MNDQQRPWHQRVSVLLCRVFVAAATSQDFRSRRLRFLSFLLLSACGGVTLMLAWHRSAHPVIGPYSIAAIVAFLLAAMGSVLSLACLLLPNPILKRFDDWVSLGLNQFRQEVPSGLARDGIFLVLLALVCYATLSFRFISANVQPRNDQLDYLKVAADIRDMGGAAELWRRLWGGTYLEANRHPLYTVLLSTRLDFDTAKWMSFWIGLIPLATIFCSSTRRAGWLVSGTAAVLIATNSVFLQSASIVACEMLLVGWTLLVWFTMTRCLDVTWPSRNQTSEVSEDFGSLPPISNHAVCCGLVGVWLGLAYLTKASAVFLLLGFVIWSLSIRGVRRWCGLALISFAAVASPLLVRNVRAFGDPLYSFNTRFLFADSFEQGLGHEYHGTIIEAKDYIRSHSATAILHRALTGLGWEGYILLRSLGPATLGASRPLVGFVVLLLAFLGAIGADRRKLLAAMLWCGLFFVFFAWYVPIASGDRFLAPVIPIVLIFAARGMVSLIASDSAATFSQVRKRVLLASVLWCFATAILSFAREIPQP